MDEKKKLVSVAGLRKADPTTLHVLTQDVLRTPLVRIEPGTLMDLLALSELGDDQMSTSMAKELARFQRQVFRELSDLPDGPVRAGFAVDLMAQSPSTIPACLRVALAELTEETHEDDALQALAELKVHADQSEPETVMLPQVPDNSSPNGSKVTVVAKTPRRTTRSSTPSKDVDTRRGEWIEGDAVERLSNYPTGLKEAILVAGSRHRAPWEDVTEKEVLTVLRRLKREGRLRFSAGRWYTSA